MEHVPNTLTDTENQIRAAKLHDADMLVRVPRGSYSDLIRPLEMNATGLMIPHVMNAEDALSIVRQTRFHPIGRRPIDGGNADGAYGNCPIQSYTQHANEQRFLILQIEDPEAMDHLDAIAAVEGFEVLFFGAGDYAHALGVAGQMDHPDVCDARKRVADAARRHGKHAGLIAIGDDVPDAIGMGYNFINLGSDVTALREYFKRAAEAFSQAVGSQ